MAVRSRRLWGSTTTTGTTQAIVYTVPAGRTAIIHSIFLAVRDGTTGDVHLRVNGSGLGQTVWKGSTGPLGAVIMTEELILNPGDTLRVFAVTADINSLGCGSLLLGEPA